MSKEKKTTFNIDKEKDFSNWYSEIIEKAEIADIRYNVKGFVVIRPWGALMIEKMYSLYEKELQKQGHSPTFFPAVIPEGNFKKEASHVEGFKPDVFWLEGKEKSDEKLALRPTSETAMYQLYSLWIRSYRDLPLKIYQRANVFRYETKATRPLIRSREFYWIEAHNCFETKKEAEKQVEEDVKTTEKVMHQIFGIPFLPLKRPKWDTFPGAIYSVASDTLMPDGKIVQQPSTHLLSQGFAKSFDVKFLDRKEKEQYVWQTCYGPAISRILSSIIATHGDNNGLVLPFALSPIQIRIIPIFKTDNKTKVLKKAEELKKHISEANISVDMDLSEYRPGEKFYICEMKGIPLRLEIGEREIKEKKYTLTLRDNKEKIKVSEKSLVEDIVNQGKELDKRLLKKADKKFKESIVDCKTKEEIKKALESKKLARVNFCSMDEKGEKCAELIETDMNAFVRGTRTDKIEKCSGKCIICGKKASCVTYVGKSY